MWKGDKIGSGQLKKTFAMLRCGAGGRVVSGLVVVTRYADNVGRAGVVAR